VLGPERAATLLAHDRQRLLAELGGEAGSAAGLARRLGLPRQRVNYHLRELEKAGLVELVEERRKGNCVERLVRATARAFVISPETLRALAADPGVALDRGSAAYQVAVAARSIREVASLDAGARREGRRLPTLTLDTEIVFSDAAARAAFAAELADALGAILARYHDQHAPGGRRYRVTALVHPVPAPAGMPDERAEPR
jgi:DNA-binding transcriptional ArsR family regulator